MKVCEKHKNTPALIYGECVGRKLEELRAEVKHWKANHADLKNRLAFLTQRPDLPVDRIPVYEEMKQELERVRVELYRFKKEDAIWDKTSLCRIVERAKAAEKERDEVIASKVRKIFEWVVTELKYKQEIKRLEQKNAELRRQVEKLKKCPMCGVNDPFGDLIICLDCAGAINTSHSSLSTDALVSKRGIK